MKLLTKQEEVHSLREQTYGCQGGKKGKRDSQRVWDGYVHTAIFKMDNQQGLAVQYQEFCSMLYGSLDGREVQRRSDTCVCMAEPLHSSPDYHNIVNRLYPIEKVEMIKNKIYKKIFLKVI